VLSTHEPHFQPWVGTDYVGSIHRLLLIGEGHYLTQAEKHYDTPSLTQEIIGRVRNGTQILPFYTRVASTVRGQDHLGSDERAEFWDRVAFYNYIPMVAASRARRRPSPDMWASAIAPFCAVVTRLRPRYVLVLGKSVWNSIRFEDGWSSRGGDQGEKAIRIWSSPNRGDSFATWIAHPSSFGYSRSKWSARVQALFAAQDTAVAGYHADA
jgi:hypothetical protein